jgi:hypothetical protein
MSKLAAFIAPALLAMGLPHAAQAVTAAEDIAVTIMLRGFECGGNAVTDIEESEQADGVKIITATCPNGVRYRIHITEAGRLTVEPI